MAKNPDWTRDELILALDLYFRTPAGQIDEKNPDIISLSELLRSLPMNAPFGDRPKFRSAGSVKTKLANIQSVEHGGRGLPHGGRADALILREFYSRREELHMQAAAIRAGARILKEIGQNGAEENDPGAEEGGVLIGLHYRRERSRKLADAKKRWALRRYRKLCCEACGIDLGEVYGPIGRRIIECHHLRPLTEIVLPRKTKLNDLALMCPNCHRAIHRIQPLPTIAEFRNEMQSRRKV